MHLIPKRNFFHAYTCETPYPSYRPTNSVKALKGKISHSMDLLTPSSHGVFQLCLCPLIAPGYLGGGLPVNDKFMKLLCVHLVVNFTTAAVDLQQSAHLLRVLLKKILLQLSPKLTFRHPI